MFFGLSEVNLMPMLQHVLAVDGRLLTETVWKELGNRIQPGGCLSVVWQGCEEYD